MNLLNKEIKKVSGYPFDRLRSLLGNSNSNSEIIDMSIGQPMHKIPYFIKDIIYNAKDNWNAYPPLSGIPGLQRAYLEWLKNRFKVEKFFDERNIIPLSGTKEGLFSIAMTLNKKIELPNKPDTKIDVSKVFNIDSDLTVKGFKNSSPWVPEVDESYVFDKATTLSILAGFEHNRRVMVQGFHGTGKSTHIEQIAARLNWPCVRINLDSHISRIDLLGKDAIKLNDGKQVTEFQEGLLPWSIQNPVALVFDEYDAGRPDVMFVIQRILEVDGKLTLLDQNQILEPHNSFRLFATTNTVGLGDMTGLYHGTQQINQGQMDRWHILSTLNYLEPNQEYKVVTSKLGNLKGAKNQEIIKNMIKVANLTRSGFANGDISTLMSPRTVISWGQNFKIFKDIVSSFELTFLNKCDEVERTIISEYFQRCFDIDIDNSVTDT